MTKNESLVHKVRREWIEHIVDKSGCDKEKLHENIRFAEDNIKVNEEMIYKSMNWNDPLINPYGTYGTNQIYANKIIKTGKINVIQFKKLEKSLKEKEKKCNISERNG
jgi:hypothetical protein